MLICFIVPSLVSCPNIGGRTDGAMVGMYAYMHACTYICICVSTYIKGKPSIRATQEPAETSAGTN
jgi:hypothetical protein